MGHATISPALLIDTDILIDAGRGDAYAVTSLEVWEQENVRLAVSVVTVMELLVGCRNKREQRIVERFLRRFEVVRLNELISDQAVALLKQYRLSHGLLIADALIAATAMVYDLPLVSKNQRDYRFIEGLRLQPYPSSE